MRSNCSMLLRTRDTVTAKTVAYVSLVAHGPANKSCSWGPQLQGVARNAHNFSKAASL